MKGLTIMGGKYVVGKVRDPLLPLTELEEKILAVLASKAPATTDEVANALCKNKFWLLKKVEEALIPLGYIKVSRPHHRVPYIWELAGDYAKLQADRLAREKEQQGEFAVAQPRRFYTSTTYIQGKAWTTVVRPEAKKASEIKSKGW